MFELRELIDPIIRIAKEAGDSILPLYQSPEQLDIQKKSDSTPVTSADLLSHKIIVKGLQGLASRWPTLSEEGEIATFDERKRWDRYWLLDPLDGTRGFINRSDEFTVNIALIEAHRSILGVLYAPVKRCCYFAYRDGGAFVQVADHKPISIRAQPINLDRIRFIVGQYHDSKRMKRVLNQLSGSELLRLSSSLKFAWLAEGRADVYTRFGAISEWDIAAGQCVLEQAGGKVVDFNGESLQYNAQESLLCPNFLAIGDAKQVDRMIAVFQA